MRSHYQFVQRKMDFLDPGQAWGELARVKTGYPPEPSGATGSGRVANFRAGAVKLPRHGAGKVALVSHLPPRWAAALETGAEIVRPPQANACRVVPAIDPVLRRAVLIMVNSWVTYLLLEL